MPEPSTTALAPIESEALPAPAYGAADMARGFTQHRAIVAEIDKALENTIIEIGDKLYRTKPFFQAVALAYNASLELVEERREVDGTFADGRDNFGYLVLYRATSKTGRSVLGDGACFALEKADSFRCPHPHPTRDGKSLHYPHKTCPDFDPEYRWRTLPDGASVHNVRSHAFTRAQNRALANLIGFGEVSAEEVEPPGERAPTRRTNTGPPATISEAQIKRLWTIARSIGWKEHEVRGLLSRYGYEHTEQITRDKYDAIVRDLERGTGVVD